MSSPISIVRHPTPNANNEHMLNALKQWNNEKGVIEENGGIQLNSEGLINQVFDVCMLSRISDRHLESAK